MNAPLIGLIGKKRTGKDTFAASLGESYDYRKVSFAEPLRQAARALDPLVGTFPLTFNDVLQTREWRLTEVWDTLGYEKAKDYVPEIRRSLQRLGTAIRDLDEEFWVRGAMDQAKALREAGTPVVITDVRFPNEADAVKAAGGYLVRIVRDLPDDGDTHPSEIALDDYREDLWIGNNGSREDLAYLAFALGRDLEYIHEARSA